MIEIDLRFGRLARALLDAAGGDPLVFQADLRGLPFPLSRIQTIKVRLRG